MSKPNKPKPRPRHDASSAVPPRANAGGTHLTSYTIGAFPLINHILDRMRLREALNEFLPPVDGRTKVSPTDVILLLVKNVLISRQPLYGIGEWAARYDPRVLGLTPQQIFHLNDDRVGRSLSKLFDSDQGSLALKVAVGVVEEFGVSLDELHNDSTTVTFFGAYDGDENGRWIRGKLAPAITHGHNKDHRPDLKQLLFVLTTSADGSVPVHFRTFNGNTSDSKTHLATWKLMRRLRGDPRFLYVADCKLACSRNLAFIHQQRGRFITILPRTRRECSAFLETLREGRVKWKFLEERVEDEKVLDYYQVAHPEHRTEEGYRLLWIHSTSKEMNDLDKRRKKLEAAHRELHKFREKLISPRTRWRDRARVAAKVEEILENTKSAQWIRVEILKKDQHSFHQESCGPACEKTRYRRVTRPSFDIEVTNDDKALYETSLMDGIFPLLTNDPEMSSLDVLDAYGRQPLLEKRFSQFKSEFEVAPVYLKNVDRIQAHLCVYFFALMAQALLEREIRQAMKKKEIESLPLYPEGKPCRNPCTHRIIDVFMDVQRHVLSGASKKDTTFVTELKPLQKKLQRLAGVSASEYRS